MNLFKKTAGALLMLLVGESAFMLAAQAQADGKQGYDLYMKRGCYQCHGTVGQGGIAGPGLAPNTLPYAAFSVIVRTPPNQMPPYSEKILSDAEMRAIHAYLVALPKPPTADSILLLPKGGGK